MEAGGPAQGETERRTAEVLWLCREVYDDLNIRRFRELYIDGSQHRWLNGGNCW